MIGTRPYVTFRVFQVVSTCVFIMLSFHPIDGCRERVVTSEIDEVTFG